MEKKQRQLKAVEAIDAGLAAAEQITIEDGIREGIKAGRLSPEVGRQCLEAYQRNVHHYQTPHVSEVPRAGWSNGEVTLRDPVEAGWDLNNVVELHPDIPDGAA